MSSRSFTLVLTILKFRLFHSHRNSISPFSRPEYYSIRHSTSKEFSAFPSFQLLHPSASIPQSIPAEHPALPFHVPRSRSGEPSSPSFPLGSPSLKGSVPRRRKVWGCPRAPEQIPDLLLSWAHVQSLPINCFSVRTWKWLAFPGNKSEKYKRNTKKIHLNQLTRNRVIYLAPGEKLRNGNWIVSVALEEKQLSGGRRRFSLLGSARSDGSGHPPGNALTSFRIPNVQSMLIIAFDHVHKLYP